MAQTKQDQSLPKEFGPFRLVVRPRMQFMSHFILPPTSSGVTMSPQETPQSAKELHEYAKLSTMLEEALKELELVKSQSRELVSKNKKLARENMAAQMDLEVECRTSASLRRELHGAVSVNEEMLRRVQEQEDSNEELRRALYAEKDFSGELLHELDRERLTTAALAYELSKVEAKNSKYKASRDS
ncbi:hypothetical protein GRF29_19g2672125 [Pseudopithomyces chartarum]|uniref:Uncharacterized protein n=1 Tax=Pseudopithomyces chartarum TaxID=1892770 RepID=A0AAN6M6M4_9PLEO|nr:hypothetical protein GRF29_19g2672125 [Pseudopithomyces chartarum]